MAAPTITRTAIVDDDGTLTTGTVINNAWKTELYGQIDAVIAAEDTAVRAGIVQTTTSTGTQNDFALTSQASLLRCNNASLLTLTGLTGGADGQRLTIVSIGAGQVDLSHQAAGSTAGNRLINFATSAVTSLAAGSGVAVLVYDATTARWRLVAHEQGAFITPTFAAGNFTANGAMTWTVDAGDVTTYAYMLRGRTLFVEFDIQTTTVGGTLNSLLNVAIPAGYTLAKQQFSAAVWANNNGTPTTGLIGGPAAATVLGINKSDLTNWAAATNNTRVASSICVEVS